MPRATFVHFGLAACAACTAPPPAQTPSASSAPATATTASSGGEIFDFPDVTGSPRALARTPEDLAPFFELCRQGDAALSRVAERFARRQSEGGAPLDVSEISFALRAEGSPYVWPRAWTLEGGDLQAPAAAERMRGWLQGFQDGGERRCGVALVSEGERSVLAAVAVDALADLAPLPVRQRAGSWLDVDAQLLVPATDAKVIVLGPSGAPYAVPTTFDGQRVRARFRADRPGPFLVQLLASVAGGPRPVLEATVYADVPPPRSFSGDPAPGEPATPLRPEADRAQALLEMVNKARATEQSPPLERDAALDAIAQSHAEAMRRLKRIAHDAGDGDPRSRVQAAALDILAAGENVAHALDVARAHRALWASPSHRENLLEPRFDKVGIGIALDSDGSIWVCEVFADTPAQPR
ncbi:MAG: Transporter [Polyangiaceae bacterium]|jgi:uncharacterized protein YkwD|nr:Transporter [Polyangiaceae bacterium]